MLYSLTIFPPVFSEFIQLIACLHTYTPTLLSLTISSFFLLSLKDNRGSILALASAVYGGDSGGGGGRGYQDINQEDLLWISSVLLWICVWKYFLNDEKERGHTVYTVQYVCVGLYSN